MPIGEHPVDPDNPATGAEPAALPRDGEEGLRAWIAQVDRKLGIRSYAGTAAVILALAAAIVAIVLAIDARDNSANNGDLTRVENRVGDLAARAGEADAVQGDLDSLDGRVADLESQLSGLSSGDADVESRISVVEDDIEDLRGQISDLGSNPADSGGTSPGPGPAAATAVPHRATSSAVRFPLASANGFKVASMVVVSCGTSATGNGRRGVPEGERRCQRATA